MKKTVKFILIIFYKIFYKIKKIGKNSYIGKNFKVTNGKKIIIGNNVSIRPNTDVFADDIFICDGCDIGTRNRIAGNVILEKNVLTGPNVMMILIRLLCFKEPNK